MVADDKAEDLAHDQSGNGQGEEPGASATPRDATKPASPDPHVSNALRTAYQATVQEEVPAEFLDLLGKLA